MGNSPVETLFPGTPLRSDSDGPCSAPSSSKLGKRQHARVWKWINIMQGYNLEIRHIPGKRNPADTLSRQDKKYALGRKTAVNDANADLVNELRVPSNADDEAIQEALKTFIQCSRSRSNSEIRLSFSGRSGHQGIRSSFQIQIRPSRQRVQFRPSRRQTSDQNSVQYSIRIRVQDRSKPSVKIKVNQVYQYQDIQSRKSVYIISQAEAVLQLINSLREKNLFFIAERKLL